MLIGEGTVFTLWVLFILGGCKLGVFEVLTGSVKFHLPHMKKLASNYFLYSTRVPSKVHFYSLFFDFDLLAGVLNAAACIPNASHALSTEALCSFPNVLNSSLPLLEQAFFF